MAISQQKLEENIEARGGEKAIERRGGKKDVLKKTNILVEQVMKKCRFEDRRRGRKKRRWGPSTSR